MRRKLSLDAPKDDLRRIRAFWDGRPRILSKSRRYKSQAEGLINVDRIATCPGRFHGNVGPPTETLRSIPTHNNLIIQIHYHVHQRKSAVDAPRLSHYVSEIKVPTA